MIPILLSLLVQVDGDWWNREWAYRRPLEIRNNLGSTLPAGHPVGVELDPAFLQLLPKARPDLSDVVVVYNGRRVNSARMGSRKSGKFVAWFPTAAPLEKGKKDTGYALYYGNPNAPPPASSGATDFGIFESFQHAKTPPKFLEAKEPLAMTIEQGFLRVRDGSPLRPGATPAQVNLRVPPLKKGFILSMEILVDGIRNVMEIAAEVDLGAPGSEDPTIVPRVRKLIGQLGDPDWEQREKATRELIKIGVAALTEIDKAMTSEEAEVRWRASHCLRMIRENSPPPLIRAGIRIDPASLPVARTFAIGKIRGEERFYWRSSLKVKLEIRRDPDGNIALTWNGTRVRTGHLPGPIRKISLTFAHPGGTPPPSFRVDNLMLRSCVDEDSRPTYVLDPEEKRP